MGAINETFNPDDKDFEDTAIEWHGNITAMADAFGIVKSTMYVYLERRPEKRAIIERARSLSDELFLDQAEFVIRYNMNQYKENPALAQKAAEKVLDKKGHKRGWGEQEKEEGSDESKKALESLSSFIQECRESINLNKDESSNNSDTKS